VAQTLTNLPLNFLYEDWKREIRALLGAPLRDTHNFLLVCLASKKYKKTSTDGEMSNLAHKIVKARMSAQLSGCSWAGATLSLAKGSFSKMDKGRRRRTFFQRWIKGDVGEPF